MSDVWEDVKAEVAAMEAWYARHGSERMGVNIYVGWDSNGYWYAGASVDGESYSDDGPYQQEADTPEEALRRLLVACREYRERIDAERAEEATDA